MYERDELFTTIGIVAKLIEAGTCRREQQSVARLRLSPAPADCIGHVFGRTHSQSRMTARQESAKLLANGSKQRQSTGSLGDFGRKRAKIGPFVGAARQEPNAASECIERRDRGLGRCRFGVVKDSPAVKLA